MNHRDRLRGLPQGYDPFTEESAHAHPQHNAELIPPVPLDALPVLTEKAPAPPPLEEEPRPAAPPLHEAPSQPVDPPAVLPEDQELTRWLTERIPQLVHEELEALTERVITRLEWDLGQKRRARERL